MASAKRSPDEVTLTLTTNEARFLVRVLTRDIDWSTGVRWLDNTSVTPAPPDAWRGAAIADVVKALASA